jgi:hypothetical protein
MTMQAPDLRALCDLLVERGLLDDAQVRSILVKENGQRQRLLRESAAIRSGRHRA